MAIIPVEVPGPISGQPGHFAHHDWLTASVKALDAILVSHDEQYPLPAAVETINASAVTVNAGATDPLNCVAAITNPHPTKKMRVMVHGASQMSVASTITAVVITCQVWKGSPMAMYIGNGSRPQNGYSGKQADTVQPRLTRLVDLDPGANEVRLYAAPTGTGSQNHSYNIIQVTPLGYV